MTPAAWLNGPCTDPLGRMLRAPDGTVLRALFPEGEADALAVLEHPVVRGLMDEGLVARMSRSGARIEGYGALVESERAAFDVPCGRFSIGALRQAALAWLEITRRLLPAELCLTDAHYGNFMLFAANQPRWIDLGSMRHAAALPEERPFRGFSRFWEGMAAPLLLLARSPGEARLARLAIGDHPYQGPCFADGEPPVSVAPLVEHARSALLSGCEDLGADAALRRALAFIEEAVALPPAPQRENAGLDERVPAYVAELLAARGCRSVACIGAGAWFAAGRGLAGRDVLVVEPSPPRLRAIEAALGERMAARSVALWLEHPLNRLFRREGMRADVVFALDPVRALEHASGAQRANIAEVLDGAAERAAVVVSPYERRASTRGMLEQRFRTISMEHFGWPYGGWDVMVCAKD
jgi:hypothetical protein